MADERKDGERERERDNSQDVWRGGTFVALFFFFPHSLFLPLSCGEVRLGEERCASHLSFFSSLDGVYLAAHHWFVVAVVGFLGGGLTHVLADGVCVCHEGAGGMRLERGGLLPSYLRDFQPPFFFPPRHCYVFWFPSFIWASMGANFSSFFFFLPFLSPIPSQNQGTATRAEGSAEWGRKWCGGVMCVVCWKKCVPESLLPRSCIRHRRHLSTPKTLGKKAQT